MSGGGNEEKGFEPTAHRLARAKREGDVARSAELAGAVAFAAGIGGLALATPHLAATAQALMVRALEMRTTASLPQIGELLYLALAPAVCAAAAAVGAGGLQTGGVRFSAPSFKSNRLSPAEGFKRMFSRESASSLMRALASVTCVCSIAFVVLARAVVLTAAAPEPLRVAGAVWSCALTLCFSCATLACVAGAADYLAVSRRWRVRLRMSAGEVKREHKEEDGDPLARGRRRSLHREFSRNSIERVREAAFVIVNPTHYAVALRYCPPQVPVPHVLVRAAGPAALRVKSLASELRLPIIADAPLARALFAATRAGDVIPKDLYVAVAQIVAALSRECALGTA